MLESFAALLGYAPACSASALACQAKDYIPDLIEPMVIPVLEAVSEHPYVSTGLSLLTAGGFLWRNYNYRNQYYAKSSGYRNNCGLHSILHLWLNLPENQIDALAETNPIFNEIVDTFYHYYQIPGDANLQNFLRLCQFFNHPLDREILLGPVLRQVLQNKINAGEIPDGIPEIDLASAFNGEMIYNNLLSILTKEMGARLIIHNTTQASRYLRYSIIDPDFGPVLWELNLYHIGVHYDFKFPTHQQNVAHNTRRHNLTNSLLVRAATISTVTEEDLAIENEALRDEVLDQRAEHDMQLQDQAIQENVLAAYLQLMTMGRSANAKKPLVI